MRALFLTSMTLIQTSFAPAATLMYVSLCNATGVSEQTVTRAKMETQLAFEGVGVDISWVACDTAASAKLELDDQLFVVHLLSDAPPQTSRNVSLEAMGRAYTEKRGSGFLADA